MISDRAISPMTDTTAVTPHRVEIGARLTGHHDSYQHTVVRQRVIC